MTLVESAEKYQKMYFQYHTRMENLIVSEMYRILLEEGFLLIDEDAWFIHPHLPGLKIAVVWRKLTIMVDTTVISSQKIECTKENLNNLIKAFNP